MGNGSVIIDRDYTTLFPNNLFEIYVLIKDLFTLIKNGFPKLKTNLHIRRISLFTDYL